MRNRTELGRRTAKRTGSSAQPADRKTRPGIWQKIRERPDPYIYLALFLAIFAIYGQVASFDFVNFDDPYYITGNPHIRNGISVEGLRWALTSTDNALFLPVTRVSELL